MCTFNIGKCLFNIGIRRTLHLTRFTMRDCFSFNKFVSEAAQQSFGRIRSAILVLFYIFNKTTFSNLASACVSRF